jgi:hypothetical protein
MIPRPLLTILVLAIPVLGLTFGAGLGGSALAGALGDAAGAYGLFWLGMIALLILVIDAILLLVILGLRALDERDGDNSR